ncbi:MAG: HYR domain-containing protein [Gaiellaceae bacterium]
MSRAALIASATVVALLATAGAHAHPPQLANVPPSMNVEATSRAGAVVTYASPTTTHPPPVKISCSPASGQVFPFGRTTVVCIATDEDTDETTVATFAVTVADTRGPALSGLPAEATIEATGPGGAVVDYALPRAVDAVDGPRPVDCRPPPGTTLPIGEATVTCRSVDSRGNVGEAKVAVRIRDTKPPVFQRVPTTLVRRIDGPGPAPVRYPAPTARDVIDGTVPVECEPPSGSRFPLGETQVFCTATDANANSALATFVVEVSDVTAPPPVTRLAAAADGKALEISWSLPEGLDVAGVELLRFPGRAGARFSVLLHDLATSFTDRAVVPGTRYRYAVVTYDHSANRSRAVTTTFAVKVPSRFRPEDGSRVTSPPTLRWPRVATAGYYNVQLYRRGVKILSIWPTSPRLKLARTWTYRGKRYRLSTGSYRWFVWPGIGPLRQARYGPLLGQSSFVLVAPDRGARSSVAGSQTARTRSGK